MFFIIPIGHNKFVVNELPFVTVGIIALCVLLYFPSSSRMDIDAGKYKSARAALMDYYDEHPQLLMRDELWNHLSSADRKMINGRIEWREWYANNAAEARAWAESFLKSEGTAQRRGSSNGLLDVMNPGVSLPGMDSGARPLTIAQRNSDAVKARAIQQLATLSPAELQAQQGELDRLTEPLVKASEQSVLYRFAFVPDRPGFPGIITYIFLHSGILLLLYNMLFLWLAAVKLEDIWGRPLFIGMFLFFGISAAFGHMLRHEDSVVPVVGASGSVAGLMGAFLIRLAKTKVKFFYFVWMFRLKPTTGVFEAPAYFMPPIWFLGELLLVLFLYVGEVAYWAQISGFLVGIAVALLFRVTGFEQRVLRRDPDDDLDVDPEEARMTAPLVAFQNRVEDHVATAKVVAPPNLVSSVRQYKEMLIGTFEEQAVNVSFATGQKRRLVPGDVGAIALGRVERIEPELGARVFAGVPAEPAYLIVLVEQKEGDAASTPVFWVVDGQKCRWAELFPGHQMSARLNMVALTKALLKVFIGVPYIQGGVNGPDNVPIYQSLENLIRTVEKKVVR